MRLFSTFLLCLIAASAFAQQPIDYAVRLQASVIQSPATITITWPADANATQYTVYSKALTDTKWQDSTFLTPEILNYVKSNVAIGKTYEFQVRNSLAGTLVGTM